MVRTVAHRLYVYGHTLQDCCGHVIGGAWAQTAVDLARARYTATALGDAQMLADSTHPESLAAIGTRRSLLRKSHWLLKAFEFNKLQLVDMVHQADPEEADAWWVLQAVAGRQPSGKDVQFLFAEKYVKHQGKWLFFSSPQEFPALQPFCDFCQRYDVAEPFLGPRHGQFEFDWMQLPPRVNRRSSLPWLEDDWPSDEQAAAAGSKPQPPAPAGWMYLDTARDPLTGLTAAQMAAVQQSFFDQAALGDVTGRPTIEAYEAWYYRHGRFVQ